MPNSARCARTTCRGRTSSRIPRDVRAPAHVRAGGREDIPFTETVDRHVRAAAPGSDIGAQPAMGQTLLDLRTDTGRVFVDGDVGPFTPYLPSGAFL